MLRKLIIKPHTATPDATTGEIDIAAVATVQVTSEAPDHPIDLAFDHHRGPGGTRWIAGEPGEQTVILAFDAPQTINQILLEVEEPEVARTQELQLCLSRAMADGHTGNCCGRNSTSAQPERPSSGRSGQSQPRE